MVELAIGSTRSNEVRYTSGVGHARMCGATTGWMSKALRGLPELRRVDDRAGTIGLIPDEERTHGLQDRSRHTDRGAEYLPPVRIRENSKNQCDRPSSRPTG